jgi:carbon storage regulator CsrA
MLVLSRRPDESIRISDSITVTVLGVVAGRVRLGIDAPRDVRILRAELLSHAAGEVDAANVNRNAVTDWESEGGRVLPAHVAA